jgi:protein tyrosine/serine phosphatase
MTEILKDFSIPTERQMIRILNQIDLCFKYDKPVYVHCLGGKGRTGTVVGCYPTWINRKESPQRHQGTKAQKINVNYN